VLSFFNYVELQEGFRIHYELWKDVQADWGCCRQELEVGTFENYETHTYAVLPRIADEMVV
jgi:hypothetical protein